MTTPKSTSGRTILIETLSIMIVKKPVVTGVMLTQREVIIESRTRL